MLLLVPPLLAGSSSTTCSFGSANILSQSFAGRVDRRQEEQSGSSIRVLLASGDTQSSMSGHPFVRSLVGHYQQVKCECVSTDMAPDKLIITGSAIMRNHQPALQNATYPVAAAVSRTRW